MDNSATHSISDVHILQKLNDVSEALAMIAESVKGIAAQVRPGDGLPTVTPGNSVTLVKSKRRASFSRADIIDNLSAVLGNNFKHFLKR